MARWCATRRRADQGSDERRSRPRVNRSRTISRKCARAIGTNSPPKPATQAASSGRPAISIVTSTLPSSRSIERCVWWKRRSRARWAKAGRKRRIVGGRGLERGDRRLANLLEVGAPLRAHHRQQLATQGAEGSRIWAACTWAKRLSERARAMSSAGASGTTQPPSRGSSRRQRFESSSLCNGKPARLEGAQHAPLADDLVAVTAHVATLPKGLRVASSSAFLDGEMVGI